MAITPDGDQLFGVSETGFASHGVIENFTINLTSNRVDINDSNGEPAGTAILPGRAEFTATLQVTGAAPDIGDPITLDSGFTDLGTDGILTSVELSETAADYQRFSVSGYIKINS